jgi:GH25 family lysozyme M1 (1,4-beta-N-acetylmuramidase)
MGVTVQLWSARLCRGATATCLAATLTTGFSANAATVDYSKAGSNFAGSQVARVEGMGAASPRVALDGALGHDVSGHQGAVDWSAARAGGAQFVYVKATEGNGYTSPQFAQQYDGSYGVGMIRGAYHFARPDVSSGADQAGYFLAHGGGWSGDGKTLPGALDMEYNPYGDACYGKDPAAMSAWIADFSNTYRSRTGRFPAIYTSTSWWNKCTGGNAGFGANPLWIARYNDVVGALPVSWGHQTIWQYANSGNLPGDQNLFNGAAAQLARFARG